MSIKEWSSPSTSPPAVRRGLTADFLPMPIPIPPFVDVPPPPPPTLRRFNAAFRRSMYVDVKSRDAMVGGGGMDDYSTVQYCSVMWCAVDLVSVISVVKCVGTRFLGGTDCDNSTTCPVKYRRVVYSRALHFTERLQSSTVPNYCSYCAVLR